MTSVTFDCVLKNFRSSIRACYDLSLHKVARINPPNPALDDIESADCILAARDARKREVLHAMHELGLFIVDRIEDQEDWSKIDRVMCEIYSRPYGTKPPGLLAYITDKLKEK